MTLDPVQLAGAYGIPHVVDYGEHRPGRGLLITTGSGLLMADMDTMRTCRWAVDLGAGRHHPRAVDWAQACAFVVSHVVAHVWMSLTSPEWMRGVLAQFPTDRCGVLAYPLLDVGVRAHDMDDLAQWASQFRGRDGSRQTG